MIKHICKLPLEREDKILFVTAKQFTLKNIWKIWCGINKKAPKCKLYMDSMATVTAERKRHYGLKHWWIIHPFSFIRFLWDMLMMIVYLISFLTIPFMICFVIMDYESIRLDKVNLPIYVICWLDILLNCITGYYDKKYMYIEMKPRKILLSYLKGFLVVDVLSSIPYDHVTLPWRSLPGNGQSYFITLINIIPLLKLARYYTFNWNISYLFECREIKNYHYELLTTLVFGLYLIHWSSCLSYLIPLLVMYCNNLSLLECQDCWMIDLQDRNLAFKFKTSISIALENILANCYGPFIPKSNTLIILSSIYMIVGKLFICYILIMFIRIKAAKKASESKFYEIMNQVKSYTRQKQLLPHMKERLLAYYYYRFKNSYFRENRILADLSEPLREEIALQSCRRLIENVTIFKNLPKDVLQSIVKSLKFELYLPNDVIVKAGSQGDCMFFLSSGTVAVLTPTGKEICHLDDGAYFGEVALLVADQRRIASVVAIEVCEVYRFDRRDFRQCIPVNSELFAKIERIATERVERTVRVEEQHKRFVMHPSYIQNFLYGKETKGFQYI